MKTPLLFSIVALLAVSLPARAVSTVTVNGYIYQCQNTCVVGVNSNGSLYVSDSDGGWVQIMARKALPVPQIISESGSNK